MVVTTLYLVDQKSCFSVIFCNFRFRKLWNFGFSLFEKTKRLRMEMLQIGIGESEIGTSHRGVHNSFCARSI